MNDRRSDAMVFFTRIDMSLGGIAISYLATSEKINELSSSPWHDESLGRYDNKIRMKKVGGATIQYNIFLHENSIMSLAKSIEDVGIDFKKIANVKFDPVKNHHGVIYKKELQMIRALANVIKHNLSHLERNTSKSAKFLVDDCGLKNDCQLFFFIFDKHESFNIIEYIPKVYLAMVSLVEEVFNVRHPVLDLEYNEAFNKIYEFLIPEVVNLARPNKELNPTN